MSYIAEDEREAVALIERIEHDLLVVLRHHTQMSADSAPRYSRWIAMHAVLDLAGRLMLSAIELEGEDVRPRLAAMVERLALLIAANTRPH